MEAITLHPSDEISALDKKIRDLEEKIADLNNRFPAHSLRPAMFAQLEELEEELAGLKQLKNRD
jgi:hypothetical protein